MGITESLREQHNEILEVTEKISSLLDSHELSKDGAPVRDLLSDLSRSLTYHLTMEDGALYPALLRHPDGEIKAVARKYHDEMGGMKDVFVAYLNKWPAADAIQKNPGDFIIDTRQILDDVVKRIDREDKGLYQLIDSN